MKKIVLVLVLSLGIFISVFIKVSAYSPHYLPGGKNYIASDNILKIGSYINTNEAFLVKPYTEYTFSFGVDYMAGGFVDILVYFYDNSQYIEEVYMTNDLESSDPLTYDNVLDVYYFNFTTPAECNYISFEFLDNGTYTPGEELIDVQLEEGNIATIYEPYIQGNIIDTSSPYFVGGGTILSYFDQPITVAEIQGSLTAYDDIDGDVSGNISLIEDNYTTNNNVLGTYTITFRVSDSSSNYTDLIVNVEVVDVLAPVFSNIGTVTAVFPNVYTPEEILVMLSASDNYDGDISSTITLVEDNYTGNNSVVGIYNMEFKCIDSSGNETYYIQEIEVVDNDGPIIQGDSSVNIGYDNLLDINNMIDNLTVTDNYDLDSSLEVVLESDTYSVNHNTIGNYQIEFSVTDSSGNKTYKTVTVNVVDEIGPVVYFDSSVIQVYSDTVLSLPDFAKLLTQTKELDIDLEYYITVKYDSYSKYSNQAGTYHMYLDFVDGYGRVLSKEFEVKVVNRPFDYVFIPENSNDYIEENFIQDNLNVLIGGGASAIVIGTNVIWYFVTKKKK